MPFMWKDVTEEEWNELLDKLTPDARILVTAWETVVTISHDLDDQRKFRTMIWSVYHDRQGSRDV